MVTVSTASRPTVPTGQTAQRRWLTRNLVVLSGVSFLQDAASDLLYPILPLFLTQVLGAPVAVVGLVEGLAEGVAAIAKLWAGRLADRWRRRPLIGLGYGLAAFAKLLIAIATAWPLVLVARGIDRLGKGIRGAPRDALLIEGIPVQRRGAAFGLHRMADTMGAVVGPAIGLAAFYIVGAAGDIHRIRPLLVIALIPAALSVVLIAAVREQARPTMPARKSTADSVDAMPRRFWSLLALLTVFNLINFPDALLLLRAHSLGLDNASVILAYIALNATAASLSYPAGRLSDRFPPRTIYAVGLGFFAIGFIGLGVAHSVFAVFIVLCIYGGFQACTDGVGKAWISRLAPASRQGSAQGLYQSLSGGAVLAAGIWAGLMWGADGQLPTLIAGCTALGIAAVLLLSRGLDPSPHARTGDTHGPPRVQVG